MCKFATTDQTVQCWWRTETTLLYRMIIMYIVAVTRFKNIISHIIDTMTHDDGFQVSNYLGLSARSAAHMH